MKARHQRLALILGALVTLGLITFFVFSALNENMAFFYSPSEIKAGKAPKNKLFRVGGLVEAGSLTRQEDGVTSRFIVTDNIERIPVHYKGILPDLFSEGKGVVAQGRLNDEGVFVAQEVLAKHNENYMPPEAAQALQKAHEEGVGAASGPVAPPPEPALRPESRNNFMEWLSQGLTRLVSPAFAQENEELNAYTEACDKEARNSESNNDDDSVHSACVRMAELFRQEEALLAAHEASCNAGQDTCARVAQIRCTPSMRFERCEEFREKSCDLGNAKTCRLLALSYFRAMGLAKEDAPKSLAAFKKACDGNDAIGCVFVGLMYERGIGVAADAQKALEAYDKLCRLGHADGCAEHVRLKTQAP
jgi:cytochrome c-type biogenesis protein CcmE